MTPVRLEPAAARSGVKHSTMRGPRNFRQGVQVKKSSDNDFFSPHPILQKSNGYFQRKLSFSKVPEGSNISQGGPTFSRGGGGPIAYSL